jgi:hypothetical protein
MISFQDILHEYFKCFKIIKYKTHLLKKNVIRISF